MLSFDALGGRFMVGRDRLSLKIGGAIARAGGKIHDIEASPASLVSFDDELKIESLDLAVAERKAIQAGLDPKRWYEGIVYKQVYLLTLATGQRFIYVWCVVDCWRSFLFLDPEAVPPSSAEI